MAPLMWGEQFLPFIDLDDNPVNRCIREGGELTKPAMLVEEQIRAWGPHMMSRIPHDLAHLFLGDRLLRMYTRVRDCNLRH